MAYTTINKHTNYFNTVTWTGTSDATTTVSGVGFQPDFTWIKNRDVADDHMVFDAVRGVTKRLFTNSSGAEGTDAQTLTSFDSDGFTTGNSRATGGDAGNDMVSWNWKAGNSSGSSNTDGTISSTVSANTTAGFSIVKYTGNGTVNSTVGHGLGTVPDFIIVKGITSSNTAWGTKSASFNSASDPNIVYLNNALVQADDTNVWGTSASFTTSTFTVGNWMGSNTNYDDYIAYCWTAKTGYSKFGKYTGNGNADGTFVYTGFKPKWLLIRRTDTGDGWMMYDDKRIGYNPNNYLLETHTSTTEYSSDRMDLLSNGFKPRYNWTAINASGGTYIYMAFGQSLVGSNNVPCTAR